MDGAYMNVYMLKDVEKVGIAGEIITVSAGFASNYLIPHKLAIQITPENEKNYKQKIHLVENRKEEVASKTSLLAQKIGSIEIKIKKPIHNDGKLYGAVSAQEIVDELAKNGVGISKNQVIFGKNIKEKGSHSVTIKLSSQLQPSVTVKVMAE
jgi:large subunit ribosomal protein L9